MKRCKDCEEYDRIYESCIVEYYDFNPNRLGSLRRSIHIVDCQTVNAKGNCPRYVRKWWVPIRDFFWRLKKKRCEDCIEWFSTFQKAFKGMECYKPGAGHCLRNIHEQCIGNFEFYKRKWWKIGRPK